MNQSSLIRIIVIIIAVLGGVYWYTASRPVPVELPVNGTVLVPEETPVATGSANVSEPTATIGTPNDENNTPSSSAAPMSVTVTYAASGFSPKTVTIKQGGTVTFKNEQQGGTMWVGANEHPSHAEYGGKSRAEHCPDTAGTAFDQCATGNAYSFTFQKVGSWDYHNHVNANDGGTIVVVP
ncbi:MAG: hypothetical protein A3C13_01105 [Candidatus Lloydbacteria bacterium RIFCSPHIGHO2_02_FULL_50_11]|nr:MAG: hypothetical protein A3C13_01105 [Candidatus Lloydbacteria bacterium RIFCSPHIGHO2_02_FULL_50_11]